MYKSTCFWGVTIIRGTSRGSTISVYKQTRGFSLGIMIFSSPKKPTFTIKNLNLIWNTFLILHLKKKTEKV